MKRWMSGSQWLQKGLIWIAFAGIGCMAAESTHLNELIAQLGNETFAVREKASADILEMGQKQGSEVEKAIVQAYRNTPDPEIRSRCKKILMQYFMETVGYLGIYYLPREYNNKQGEIQWVVGVGDIAPDSPAKLGGLQQGDVILAINGLAIDGVAPDKDFAKRIQMLGAGKPVTLQVARGDNELDIKVTLTKRTIALTDVDTKALFKARIEEIEKSLKTN